MCLKYNKKFMKKKKKINTTYINIGSTNFKYEIAFYYFQYIIQYSIYLLFKLFNVTVSVKYITVQ